MVVEPTGNWDDGAMPGSISRMQQLPVQGRACKSLCHLPSVTLCGDAVLPGSCSSPTTCGAGSYLDHLLRGIHRWFFLCVFPSGKHAVALRRSIIICIILFLATPMRPMGTFYLPFALLPCRPPLQCIVQSGVLFASVGLLEVCPAILFFAWSSFAAIFHSFEALDVSWPQGRSCKFDHHWRSFRWEISWETRETRPCEGGHSIQQRETRRKTSWVTMGDKLGNKLADKLEDKGGKASGRRTHHPTKGKKKTSWETSGGTRWETSWDTRETRPREGGRTIQERWRRTHHPRGNKKGDKLGDKGDKALGRGTHYPTKGNKKGDKDKAHAR